MAAQPRTRIVVLHGGRSSEHDVSLASGRSVLDVLDPARYEAIALLLAPDGRWLTEDGGLVTLVPGAADPLQLVGGGSLGPIDVVFPVLHGPFGEDGTVQGLLELLDLPYVGSGVLGSALAMDKDRCKAALRDAGIVVAASLTLDIDRNPADAPATRELIEQRFDYPVFVKPARLGSSVGISKVHGRGELVAALELGFRHDERVLVEEFLVGREVECAVLGNDAPIASVVGGIVIDAEWYDYEAKYAPGGMRLEVPAQIDAAVAERVRAAAVEAFRVCDLDGLARIDFFACDDGRVVLNEVNTLPGFTATSVYGKLFEASGIGYAELVDRLVALAIARHAERALRAW